MVFADLFFLFCFLPAFLLLYLLAGRLDRSSSAIEQSPQIFCRNLVLVIFSLLFYAWGEPVYVMLMILSVFVNYLIGLGIGHLKVGRKAMLFLGVGFNVLVLGTFKYAGFFAQTLCDIGLAVTVPRISLPIGISFYTFQSLSYLVDVYRRKTEYQKHFDHLLLYVSMFPQLIAGPIVRYDTIASEIENRHTDASDIAYGLHRFFIGLGKKVLLANQLSEISDRFLHGGLHDLSTTGAWLGIIAFTFQIYYDFSGYSDMAIGMGRCMGFHFKENFDHPYLCRSITDFWRRWHISLGSFFRDYVYIPLGGNRRHQAVNILIVWFLTGMWHGASWNFILWGVYFGLIVMIEKHTIMRLRNVCWRPLLHVYSLFLVIFGWSLFYYDDLGEWFGFVKILFGGAGEWSDYLSVSTFYDYFGVFVACLLFSFPTRRWAGSLLALVCKKDGAPHDFCVFAVRMVISTVALVLSVAMLVGATNNAFIYTRF